VVTVSAFKPTFIQKHCLNLAWRLPDLFQAIGIAFLGLKDQSSVVVNITILATLSLNNLLDEVAQLFNGHGSDSSLGTAFRHNKRLTLCAFIFAASDFAWRCQNLQRLRGLG